MDEDRLDTIEQGMVRLENNQSWIKEQLGNHLAHHDKYLFYIVGAIGSLTLALVLNFLKGIL